jgi:hypothetical protein
MIKIPTECNTANFPLALNSGAETSAGAVPMSGRVFDEYDIDACSLQLEDA